MPEIFNCIEIQCLSWPIYGLDVVLDLPIVDCLGTTTRHIVVLEVELARGQLLHSWRHVLLQYRDVLGSVDHSM